MHPCYRLHWHIDYLLIHPAVMLTRIVLCSPDPTDECPIHQQTAGQVILTGFGASDCRAGCGAHLLRVRA